MAEEEDIPGQTPKTPSLDSEVAASVPLVQILEELNVAAALIDSDVRVLALTTKMNELGDFSGCSPGSRPRHWNQEADERIRRYLCSAISDRAGPNRTSVPLLVDGDRGRPLVVKAIPLRQRPLKHTMAVEAVVIVMDLEANPAPCPHLLQYIFDFTQAEARLASQLGAGNRLTEAARTLAISPGTARQHLKSVFIKTGCRRQAELLSLLARLTALKSVDGTISLGGERRRGRRKDHD